MGCFTGILKHNWKVPPQHSSSSQCNTF